jgi:hypothetical protein
MNIDHPTTKEQIEYLEDNGFEIINGAGILAHTKECRVIIMPNDTLNVYQYDDGEYGQRSAGFNLVHHFTGLKQLDIVKFGMLMHVCGAIPMDESYKRFKSMRNELIKTCVQLAEENTKQLESYHHSHARENFFAY